MGGTARPAWQLEQGSWSGVGVVLHTSLPGLCAAPGRAGSEPVRAVSRALPQASQAGSMSTSYHREDAALTRRILSLQGRRGSPCVCVCVCVCVRVQGTGHKHYFNPFIQHSELGAGDNLLTK